VRRALALIRHFARGLFPSGGTTQREAPVPEPAATDDHLDRVVVGSGAVEDVDDPAPVLAAVGIASERACASGSAQPAAGTPTPAIRRR
jgi:hypothetical protein